VDGEQQDTEEPIVFSEWSFPNNDAFIYRKDYTFKELLEAEEKNTRTGEQIGLSLDEGEGRFVSEYKCHYRRLGENV